MTNQAPTKPKAGLITLHKARYFHLCETKVKEFTHTHVCKIRLKHRGPHWCSECGTRW